MIQSSDNRRDNRRGSHPAGYRHNPDRTVEGALMAYGHLVGDPADLDRQVRRAAAPYADTVEVMAARSFNNVVFFLSRLQITDPAVNSLDDVATNIQRRCRERLADDRHDYGARGTRRECAPGDIHFFVEPYDRWAARARFVVRIDIEPDAAQGADAPARTAIDDVIKEEGFIIQSMNEWCTRRGDYGSAAVQQRLVLGKRHPSRPDAANEDNIIAFARIEMNLNRIDGVRAFVLADQVEYACFVAENYSVPRADGSTYFARESVAAVSGDSRDGLEPAFVPVGARHDNDHDGERDRDRDRDRDHIFGRAYVIPTEVAAEALP